MLGVRIRTQTLYLAPLLNTCRRLMIQEPNWSKGSFGEDSQEPLLASLSVDFSDCTDSNKTCYIIFQ